MLILGRFLRVNIILNHSISVRWAENVHAFPPRSGWCWYYWVYSDRHLSGDNREGPRRDDSNLLRCRLRRSRPLSVRMRTLQQGPSAIFVALLRFGVDYELEEATIIETFFTEFGLKPADDFYSHLMAPNESSRMHIILDCIARRSQQSDS